jgi:hypothetical protein
MLRSSQRRWNYSLHDVLAELEISVISVINKRPLPEVCTLIGNWFIISSIYTYTVHCIKRFYLSFFFGNIPILYRSSWLPVLFFLIISAISIKTTYDYWLMMQPTHPFKIAERIFYTWSLFRNDCPVFLLVTYCKNTPAVFNVSCKMF